VLAFLLYVYYSSQILFMGGEFTQVYARRHGSQQPATSRPAISREAALMVTTAATSGAARHSADIDALRRRQYAAVATAGMVGLVGGAAIGGVGLVMGVARGARKLRGRAGSSFRR
jgi:membrane protein